MKYKIRNHCGAKKLLTVFLCLITFLLPILPCFAAELDQEVRTTRIKVAFYPLDGFFEYDENGNEVGYGVDYLNELSKYANIEWEYVPVDSWEAIKDLMQNGDVDVRMPVSEPASGSPSFSSFTTESILLSYHAIMTTKDRTDLFYKDYDSIRQMKIGVSKTLVERTGMSDYLNSIGIQDHLISFDDYNSCRSALEAGTIDGLISNVMDLTDDLKILDRFCISKTYITTLKDSPYYPLINHALTELSLENPGFQSELTMKYYPDRTLEPFTKEETAYMDNTKQLTVGVYSDRKPVSFYNTKTECFDGIAIDIANAISKKINIEFNYVPITTDTPRDMLNTIDLIMPVVPDGDPSYFVTPTIMETEIMLIVRSRDGEPTSGEKVGVLSRTPGIRSVLEKQEDWNLVFFDSNETALKALKRGEITAFANSSYVVDWLVEIPQYEKLSVLRYQGVPIEFSICGKAENELLQSILTKGIPSVTEDEKAQIIVEDTSYSLSDMTTLEKIYIYRIEIAAGVVILLLILFAGLFYNHSRTKFILEIQKKGQEQEKANHAKTDFLSRMSHDMRTPMNGILGMVELSEDENDPAILKQNLEKIKISSRYLLGLINDTLDFQKIESGKLALEPEIISSKALLDSIVSLIKPSAEEKGIYFKMTLNQIDTDCYIMTDPLRIKQIFLNLLSNAVKFTPADGTVELRLNLISREEMTSHLTITVTDTGIGMSKEYLDNRIFQPFSQEHNAVSSQYAGTGLGLSIAKKLVELMKGTIAVESELGAGTKFTVRISFVRVDKDAAAKAVDEDTTRKVNALELLKGKHILLAEDHPLNAEIAKRLLEKAECIVSWAKDGQECVDMFSQSAEFFYDIILMDIRMPVLDGLDAARTIRLLSRADAAAIPIVAMTANAYSNDVKNCLDAGMNGHISKPIDPLVMYETITNNLRR